MDVQNGETAVSKNTDDLASVKNVTQRRDMEYIV